MLKIGITGGIGTGKSTVCSIFKLLNVPVFNADVEAKKLYTQRTDLKEIILKEFGANIYEGTTFYKERLAQVVFSNKEKLQRLNELIHPMVQEQSEQWFHAQDAPYAIKEAALMIESGSHKHLDQLILVQSPLALRIERVAARDLKSKSEIEQRINNQMPEAEKEQYAQHIIYNNNEQALIPQVMALHNKLMNT